uniref:putative insulin-like growth factor 2 antisense gene protein n=1 Tax=Nyctereutes procyonoides TaxID=34880 RepID=UPI0024443B2B|nr:putative insulin-like growth factor 2 antisense gene protein [Nyctereutes procyonoides]
MTQPGPAPSNAGRADVAGAAKRPPGPEAGGGSCGYVRGAGDAVAGRWDAACGAGRRGQAPGPGRGGGTAPTFPASGPGVRGAEPPERCLPPSSSPRPRPAARHTILAGSGSRAERLVSAGAGVSAGRRGKVERSSREKEEARGQRREAAGGGTSEKGPRGAGGWNVGVPVTAGILRRKRAAHAPGWALKPHGPQGAAGRRGSGLAPRAAGPGSGHACWPRVGP